MPRPWALFLPMVGAVAVASAVAGEPDLPALTAHVESLWNAGARDSSRALLTRGIAVARVDADTLLLIDLLVRDGAQDLQRGDARRAEPGLREAVRLGEAWDDSLRLCAAVRWLSVAVGLQGRMPEARLLYRRLLDLATATGDRRHQGWALVGMGWEAWREGRAAEAGRHYGRATHLFREAGERDGEIWAQNGLGNALSRSGDYQRASVCFARAAELARAAGLVNVEIMALNNLGSLEYGLGDPGHAQGSFGRALELARRNGSHREAVTPAVNLAICELDLGRHADAAATLDSCLADVTRHSFGDLEAMVLVEQASLLARRGRVCEAVRLYRRCLALGQVAAVDVRTRALAGLSDALAAADSGAVALTVVREAARVAAEGPVNELRATLELTTGRRLRELRREPEALPHLREAARLARQLDLGGLRVEALVLAARCERARQRPDSALVLLESAAAAWEAERGLPLDPEWRERRGASGQAVYTQMVDMLLGPDEAAPSRGRVGVAFDRLQPFKARTLSERMTGPASPASTGADAGGSAVTLAALQRDVLRPDELLLDYCLGPDVSILFMITRDDARAVRLPGEGDLSRRLRLYHGLLATPPAVGMTTSVAEVAAAGAALARDLLGAAATPIDACTRIVVAPDGAVNLVPFAEWLPGHDVVRVPSATVLALLRAHGRPVPRDGAPRLLAIAGGEDALGRPLAGARREARELGRRYRGVAVRLADHAADTLVAADLTGADVLHLAAHLRADDQRPWRSRLRFGDADAAAGLTAAQIEALPLEARLAFLSSCSSAGGSILSGEGVLGMTGAFLGAGTQAVVATLWPVDDAVTARLVSRFYVELSRGATVSTSLRLAQQSLREDPATAHPFFWAAFVVAGDGAITAPLAPRGTRRAWLWASVTAMAGAGVVAVRARRRSRARSTT